ncbi:hypothetical protein HDU81_000325, partial [Chytriomyces hyalinus]
MDCKDVFSSILTAPILRPGEVLKHAKIVTGLRMALMRIFEFWDNNVPVRNEAEYLRNMWNMIFSIHPLGISTTASETTMKASKACKLNTEDRMNVRGLQSDISWETRTGITLCWGEGKVGDATENISEAESASVKCLKGAKDCIDYVIKEYGQNVEIFSMTLL